MFQKMSPSQPAETLEEELLQLLAVQGRRVPVPVFIGALIIAGLVHQRLSALVWGGWLSCVIFMLALRWVLLARLPQMTMIAIPRRLKVASLLSLANGVIHASSLIFFFWLNEFERVIQTFLLLGLCTGAIATTAGFRPIFYSYLLPIAIPMIVLWAVNPGGTTGWIESSTSFVIFLFCAILMALAQDAARLFRQSFDIRLRQIELNSRLQSALQEAQNANYAKTLFLASASHDLRQPMHALAMFSSALGRSELNEQARAISEHIASAVQAMKTQLDALLDLSRLDAGAVKVTSRTIDLSRFLGEVHARYRQVAEDKGLLFHLFIPAGIYVSSDPALFDRVIGNLIDNAIKYTDHGSVQLTAGRRGDIIAICIIDTGCGIPEADTKRVFDEFYQVGNPERDRTRGLGLGLSIVKRHVEKLGIELNMTSLEGVGTRFELLMRVKDAGEAAAASSSVSIQLKGIHVLVIDDDSEIREGTRKVLEAEGMRVRVCATMEQACSCVRQTIPDIVLADYRLAGSENGLTVVRAIRAIAMTEGQKFLPALLISGDDANSRQEQARFEGLRLLIKPILHNDLLQEMVRAIQEGAPVPSRNEAEVYQAL